MTAIVLILNSSASEFSKYVFLRNFTKHVMCDFGARIRDLRQNKRGPNKRGQNIPGQNVLGKTYADKTYQTQYTGQKI